MATALTTPTGAFSASYSTNETLTIGFQTASLTSSDTAATAFANAASGAGKMNLHWETKYAVTAGDPYVLQLTALPDNVDKSTARTPVTFTKIKAFWLRITDTSPAGTITIAPNGTNGYTGLTGASGSIVVGRIFMLVDDATANGLTVPDNSGTALNKLSITASAGTINISIGIAGFGTVGT